MQNCNSSARTAAKTTFKCSLLFRPATLAAILMLCAVSSNLHAGIVPIPMPIYSSNGGSRNGIISLWLALNLFFIVYFIIRAIIYPIIKNKIEWTNSWGRFIVSDTFSDDCDMKLSFTMWTFIGLNSIAILFKTADWIGTFLK